MPFAGAIMKKTQSDPLLYIKTHRNSPEISTTSVATILSQQSAVNSEQYHSKWLCRGIYSTSRWSTSAIRISERDGPPPTPPPSSAARSGLSTLPSVITWNTRSRMSSAANGRTLPFSAACGAHFRQGEASPQQPRVADLVSAHDCVVT